MTFPHERRCERCERIFLAPRESAWCCKDCAAKPEAETNPPQGHVAGNSRLAPKWTSYAGAGRRR